MTPPRNHTAAVLPPAGYRRPPLLGADGLTVDVVGERGEALGRFNFSDTDAPLELTEALVGGFARLAGPGGEWGSVATVRNAASVLRRFAREVSAANPEVTTIGDVTPEVWWAWRSVVESNNRWPAQINQCRTLLRNTEGLPRTTQRAINASAPKPKKRTYDAYSKDEFRQIRSAARRTVAAATKRIVTNVEVLAQYRSGENQGEPELIRTRSRTWTRGEILDHLSLTGKAPDLGSPSGATSRQARVGLGVAGRYIKEALFLTTAEVYALMILFVCEHGYNASVLGSMTVGGGRADNLDSDDPVYLVDLDKPRRGSGARFFTNAFTGTGAGLWESAVLLTQPARDALTALGHPTDKLLISGTVGRSTHPTGVFKTEWPNRGNHAADRWNRSTGVIGDDGRPLRVTLSRLRLTEQVLNQKSSQNRPEVSERVYRLPDPQTRARAREVILQGQTDALQHALATVRMRTITPSELAEARTDPTNLARTLGVEPEKVALLMNGQLDTATGACLDYTNSPFEESPNEPCRASFLNCFACPNAVATQEHLPRLVLLYDTLVDRSSAVTQQEWQVHYVGHFARLEELLTHHVNEAEITAARATVSNADRETVQRLLSGKLNR